MVEMEVPDVQVPEQGNLYSLFKNWIWVCAFLKTKNETKQSKTQQTEETQQNEAMQGNKDESRRARPGRCQFHVYFAAFLA